MKYFRRLLRWLESLSVLSLACLASATNFFIALVGGPGAQLRFEYVAIDTGLLAAVQAIAIWIVLKRHGKMSYFAPVFFTVMATGRPIGLGLAYLCWCALGIEGTLANACATCLHTGFVV